MTVVAPGFSPRGGDVDDRVVVALSDSTLIDGLGALRTTVGTHLLEGGSTVVVDISGVRRLSSGTVAALLWAKRHCRSRGGSVIVRGPSSDSLAMLTRSGLGDVFELEVADPQTPGRGR